MRVGFTGARAGPTEIQRQTLLGLLLTDLHDATTYHHGGALGADTAFHALIKHELPTSGYVVLHPCDLSEQRTVGDGDADEVRPVKRPLDRNRDIVDESDLLVACPSGPEMVRSGTWATVRYARKVSKPIIIVWPDGRVEREGSFRK